ncbi:MAG: GNAT family N-acetyltransferase [Bdellovibrionota bacterium]|jgi:N-acetylglutamate synthase-like GNAT family acetyltransferase
MTHELKAIQQDKAAPLRPLTVAEQMLGATELLHYADKFRGYTFACVIGQTGWLGDFFLDIKVFYLAHIRILICCVYRPWLESQVAEWNSRGYALDYFETTTAGIADLAAAVKDSISKQRLPVIAIKGTPQVDVPPSKFHDDALAMAAAAGSQRAFILSSAEGIIINNRLLSHISSSDVINIPDDAVLNVSRDTLNYLATKQLQYGMELVVLHASAGSMFQEVFSHIGIGTLLSDMHKILFRGAKPTDARDIAFIMKPYVQAGALLPVSEDSIVQNVENYYVYTINEDVVGVGRLTEYGEGYELGKLATLPRYRRKGLARSMLEELIKRAVADGKKFVFSLTIESIMVDLLTSLGFSEVARETLPESWKNGYDFKRPSRAFLYNLP